MKLNPKLFSSDVEQEATREGFGRGLLKAGELDENVVGLCADLTDSTKMSAFAKAFPDRFIQVGVAEQNLATVASGMATMGKIPFISSYATFSPGRNWEQIRTTICYNNVKVIIAGNHAGVSVGPDGGSHQALEDIAMMRALPRMAVLSPCDSIEAEKATLAAAKARGPVYIRLAREKTPIITTVDTPFIAGKANVLRARVHAHATIIATGGLVYNALIASEELARDEIECNVINLHTIKPIDKDAIINAARQTGHIVTVEEHQVMGGMGSAVAEVLAEAYPVPMRFVGVRDQFGQSGKPSELIEYYGLGVHAIKRAVKSLLSR